MSSAPSQGPNNTMYKKKLIEVALPLDAINRGCESDKNRKTGHIRNLHKWFAPMPLPAWRSMLFAALVDDPGEHLGEEQATTERRRLFKLIEYLAAFDSFKDHAVLDSAREELRRSGERLPAVTDFFCGGGSTVLEAQRLGLCTRASDLNPIPVLITTILCRIGSLFANQGSVHPKSSRAPFGGWSGMDAYIADVTNYAKDIRERAKKILQPFYPPIGSVMPHAYRWAWSVQSIAPTSQNLYTPLVSNWWLSRHKSSVAWVDAQPSDAGIQYQIRRDGKPPSGSVGRKAARCLYSNEPIPIGEIRAQGRKSQLRQTMFAIIVRSGSGISFHVPNLEQIEAVSRVPVLDKGSVTMPKNPRWFSPPLYGLTEFRDLFNPRQSYALTVFADEVADIRSRIEADAISAGMSPDPSSLENGGKGAKAYADGVTAMLGLCVSKMAQSNSMLVRWFIDPRNGSGKATPAFDRHAIPWVWDYVETNPFGGSVGDWTGPVLQTALRALQLCVPSAIPTEVMQMDARDASKGVDEHSLIATDPPYYANIGYADLSDYFYQWLRPSLQSSFPHLFSTVSTPKATELIATPYRHEGSVSRSNEYFRQGFAEVFRNAASAIGVDYPVIIVYAIKQSEEGGKNNRATGWEVFLDGLIDAGLSVTATWPIRTTTQTRMIGLGTNSLASAIFVVCRPRAKNLESVSRRGFVAQIKRELPDALVLLQKSNIAPVDLAQAAIGPGMAVYTRYDRVLESDGSPLTVRTALALINQVLDEVLAEQEGDFDADTRWALAWFEQHGFSEGDFGVAETLSKAKNTSVAGLVDAGVLASKAGKVRLLAPGELEQDWDPTTDQRLTVWEMVHHLIRKLESGGEGAAAELAAKLGSNAETARELAYRLYTLCERKKRAGEALAYNALVQSWPEISRLAQQAGRLRGEQPKFEAMED